MKNVDTFDNKEISNYLFLYFRDYAIKNNLGKNNDNGRITYNVSKSEFDKVVKDTFGKTDYEIVESNGRNGIKK